MSEKSTAKNAAEQKAPVKETEAAANQKATAKIIWDDREMNSSYANVCNVARNNDEVMLLFGTSEAWNSAQTDIKVKLSNRIIVTPATAQRLKQLLDTVSSGE